MNTEKWPEIKRLFNAAADLPADERGAWVDDAEGFDDDVRAEVRRLLAVEERTGFDRPFVNFADLVDAAAFECAPGTRFGEYVVKGEIGRGGMGVVVRAERELDGVTQTVAVKILMAGQADGSHLLRRFATERRILASLEHRNIARLIDAGRTADGRPFFAMEFVDGRPLTDYCDESGASLAERLRLFLQVCDAVAFAHARLVVHRDLKPSNILVSATGEVKLLDFGISKIVGDEAPASPATTLAMMTPAYASPEQIRGDVVSTASDIYSLGLVLFELLTGAPAYAFESSRPDEMARVICDVEPARPSSVVSETGPAVRSATGASTERPRLAGTTRRPRNPRALRGDIDNIVLKALRKDPARRYATVGEFAGDIRRHLDGQTVLARPDTFSYRFGKFVARNRAPVAATVVVALALFAATAISLWQANRARVEKLRAEKRFAEVRELANQVVFRYDDEIRGLQGSTRVRELLVSDALRYLDSLRADAADDEALTRELALAYMRVGNVQGGAYQANLGDSAGAAESFAKAIALLEPFADGTTDPRTLSAVIDAYADSSRVFYRAGDVARRDEVLAKSLPAGERLVALAPDDRGARLRFAGSLVSYGDSLPETDQAPKIASFKRALAEIDALPASPGVDVATEKAISTATHRLQLHLGSMAEKAVLAGDAAAGRDLFEAALTYAGRCADAQSRILATNPASPVFQRNFAGARLNLARIRRGTGETSEAIALASAALATLAEIAARDRENLEIRLDEKEAYDELMLTYVKRADASNAEASFRRSAAIVEELLAKDPSNLDYWIARLRGELIYADALRQAGNATRASGLYADILERARTKTPEKLRPNVADITAEAAAGLSLK